MGVAVDPQFHTVALGSKYRFLSWLVCKIKNKKK